MKRTIKSIRIDLGLKQVEMAKILGITSVAYSKKETGKSPFTAKEFMTICEMGKISAHDVEILK